MSYNTMKETFTPLQVRLDDSGLNLARLWVKLDEVKRTIENEIIPLGAHLGIEDPQLLIALDKTVDAIINHVTHYRLQASRRER